MVMTACEGLIVREINPPRGDTSQATPIQTVQEQAGWGALEPIKPIGIQVNARIEWKSVEFVPVAEAQTAPRRRQTLADLIAGVTVENSHPATDWGPSVGNEILP
jgi:antitoxin component of MazEF toxin-antitoxin module